MVMDLGRISELIDLLATSTLVELEVEDADGRVRLTKRGGLISPQSRETPVAAARPSASPPLAATTDRTVVASTPFQRIAAPMTGIFYRAPAPGEKPFVVEGDRIKAGQTLGVIEAMKTLTSVVAQDSGRLRRVCVNEGEMVEGGHTLFEVE